MTPTDFKRDLLLQRGDLLAQRRNLDDNLAKIEGALMAMVELEKAAEEKLKAETGNQKPGTMNQEP